MSAKRVLSVGQCAADHWGISRTLEGAFPVEVVSADTSAEAMDKLRQDKFALVLINRIFDADGASGLDLIRKLKADPQVAGVPVLLVSNYADAQQEAVKAGAAPGFGKAALGRAEMLERVREFLAQ
jgi:CheY-like chemotaxis protein